LRAKSAAAALSLCVSLARRYTDSVSSHTYM
jgi:hypothetical protein